MYKVCIQCNAYNHSGLIEDAMNGFVMQKTDFPFVAAIVDDASTDGTPRVITNFFERNFNIEDKTVSSRKDMGYGTVLFARHRTNLNCYFAILLLNENHYSQRKRKDPYLKPWVDNSEYIALCEGDDYWTDSLKLQKQVDYMEVHPECCMAACSAIWRTEEGYQLCGCQKQRDCDLSTDEVIRKGGYYLATASLLFRKELSRDWPLWRRKANVGDFPLQILGALRGTLHFFQETMCAYRFRVVGSFSDEHRVWSADFLFAKIAWMKLLDRDTRHKYRRPIYFNLFNTCYRGLFITRQVGLFKYLTALIKSDHKFYNAAQFREDIKSRLTKNHHSNG
jgi:glycosyltransferase involved in cell wall biosynthesis